MKIPRKIASLIEKKVGKNKVLLLFGTRRTGKSFLLKTIENKLTIPFLHLNAEDVEVQQLLSNRSIANYKRLVDNNKLLIIDEAQVIPNIGNILKLIIDELNDLTIIATGSSSFDLSNKTGAPLTGRNFTFHLYPVAQTELSKIENLLQTKQNLEERLVFGSYPEIITLETLEEKEETLRELVNSYLLKDILTYERIQNSKKIKDLLRLIAYQVGAEVSYNELARQLGISKNTVERYLDLLVKVNILFSLNGYSNNPRKEIAKSSKWFFYDNGIRNAIIGDFRLPAIRQDMGTLWENYCIYERIKRNTYAKKSASYYFWRTYDKQEIDLIEVHTEDIQAYEFKWGKASKKIPAFFEKTYPKAPYSIINPNNYLDFID